MIKLVPSATGVSCRHHSGTPAVDRGGEVQDPGDEAAVAAATHITAVGAGVNVVLAGAKAAAGYSCGSTALVADAVHSLSDLFSDVATIITVQLSRAPPDEDHPYGHGRFEHVGALCVSALLGMSGAAIGFHSYEVLMTSLDVSSAAGSGLLSPLDAAAGGEEIYHPLQVAAAVAGSSIVAKELLYRRTLTVARQTSSDTLLANAWHHRSDALSSVPLYMYISDTDLFGHTCSLCCRPFDCQFSLVFATGVSDDWAFLGGLGRRAGGHWWRASWAPAARPAGRVCCWWHDSENCRGNRLEKFKTADRHCRRGSRASLKPIVYDACGINQSFQSMHD